MKTHKRSKKQIIKLITQYGIHIWAILIIANAALVYTYHFATHAADKSQTKLRTLDISNQAQPTPDASISPSVASGDQSQPSPTPIGPVINLTFSVPGIGSGGGVMKPIHLKRHVTVYLYATDVNSLSESIKPLYTIQGTANYDDNPESGTYTSFINPAMDLGKDVQDGDYQVAFRTDQSLRTLIKQNSTDLGGQLIGLHAQTDTVVLPPQTVLMGDTIPDKGDNNIDVNDYNAFINCYGSRITSSFCQGKNYGDFNDDGVIDGVDYNILLRSLYVLAQEGESIPVITPTISVPKQVTKLINPTKAPKKTITPQPTGTPPSSGGGSIVGGILFIIFLLILGVIGFLVFRKNDQIREMIKAIIHMSPTGEPSVSSPETPSETTNNNTDSAIPAKETPEEVPSITKPPGQQEKQETSTTHTAGETIEKDCYVKTKGKDETGTGMWLLLTDDNGPIQAHYAKNDAKDGFAKVTGVMKQENGKTFLEVTQLSAEE